LRTDVSAKKAGDVSISKGKKYRKKTVSSNNKNRSPGKTAIETWRLFGISVHPDDLAQDDRLSSSPCLEFPTALRDAVKAKFGLETIPDGSVVVRRSLDARKKLDHPVYSFVVDIPISKTQRQTLGWRVKSGKMERLLFSEKNESIESNSIAIDVEGSAQDKTVVVVGMGPAGLFCALHLALAGIKPILLDRGQPVEKRGRDIGALMHRRSLDEESNFAFGEGGAGTWSDGKLTTRIGRNAESVRSVLQTLVEFGAPSNIL
jgi:hypothetical protein